MATIPFSPRLAPSMMNWFESTVLPEPEGPATRTEYPRGMPPPQSVGDAVVLSVAVDELRQVLPNAGAAAPAD